MRIALLAVLAFAGLWLVALRPKPVAEPAPPAPAAAPAPAPAAAAKPAATGARAATDGAKPAQAGEKPGSKAADKPSAGAAETPAVKSDEKVAPPVRAVLDDVADRKVVVLLFWNRKGSDDREVRRALSAVDRRDGKVAVHDAPIGELGDFEVITRGLPVVTSPSVLVIDRTKRTRVISGLTVTREIDQTVDLALRSK
jgi:hypothetical protein